MKKSFLAFTACCFISTLSLASYPDEPIKVVTSAESQFVMAPLNDVVKNTSQSEMTIELTGNGCIYYGIEAAYAEASYYGYDVMDDHAMRLIIKDYVDICKEVGGAEYMLDPVFL